MTTDDRRFSAAYQRNADPIAGILKDLVIEGCKVLEIGSGSGEHAVDYARRFPTISWQPSDRPAAASVPSILAWRDEFGVDNVLRPLSLDLSDERSWPGTSFDIVIAINVIHIADWAMTAALFKLANSVLDASGLVFLYGPFRYQDQTFAPSNEAFDQQLRQQNPQSGIRCFEEVDDYASQSGFKLQGDRAMPANNRSIWWQKLS